MFSNNSPRERRHGLAAALRRANLDCAIVSNPKHIFYFTGFPTNLNAWATVTKGQRSTSFLLISDDARAYLLLGASEISSPWGNEQMTERAAKIVGVDVETYADYLLEKRMVTYADTLGRELKKWIRGVSSRGIRLRRVGVEEWHLASTYRNIISRESGTVRLPGISRTLLDMRRIKGSDEIEHLKTATGMIDFAYAHAKEGLRLGMSEIDLFNKINSRAVEKYGPFGMVIGDYISGERTLSVTGSPTSRRFKKGDTIILDLQAASNNYWSDMCRTFVVGRPRQEQYHVQAILTRAMKSAEKLLRPGTKGKEIYGAVADEIVRGGYPKLVHHAGHSIGLDNQEAPWFIPADEEVLEEGMVCVVEPGIYIPSAGGMRIEDCYAITKNGNKRISKFAYELD